ncbi:gibberellin-regulated protein 11 [Cajanus cajan]|uniref:gibberellin-regulated protein 11 n=1 Tax=Cajanus cajan TaxID=3821 RepID=UPI00098D8959|nr:gibberellin-regulated protein 11 [Cajanus cajan]
MAFSKALMASILISLVILNLVESNTMVIWNTLEGSSSSPAPPKIDCDGECKRRCELSSRQNLCKRACGTCCDRCNCVPSGTSGNYDECPCYANMTTHGGRHKCP